MPRRVQDIIPAGRRSIRDVPLRESSASQVSYDRPSRRAREDGHSKDEEPVKIHRSHIEHDDSPVVPPPDFQKKQNSKSSKRKFPWAVSIIGIVLVLAGVGYFASSHFARATFTLVPKVITAKVNGTFVIPATTSKAFGYEILTIDGSASTTIPATLGKYTETKAQGTVTMYNAYTSQSQKLVAGTRFSANSGLVYRLTSSIVIPGYKKSGTTIIPGSIKATIVADKAGAEYNISRSDTVSDLNVVAYKGTDKYKAFYARLSSDISGGFAGTKTVVSPTVLASTTSDLERNASFDLQHRLLSSIPDGYVMYQDSYVVRFDKPVVASISTSSASETRLSVSATAYGIMLKKVDLARFLAGASSTDVFGKIGYIVPDIDKLSFTMTNQKDFIPTKKGNVVARINGTFDIIGDIPADQLKQETIGIQLSQTQNILKKYNTVIDLAKSRAEINPPWVSTVPVDKTRISIVIKEP